MRTISKKFISELKTGKFNQILDCVIKDYTLDLEIRDGYINIYFKGNSILKLFENGNYEINEKFLFGTGMSKSGLLVKSDVKTYIDNISNIKANVIKVKSKRPTLEIEYEQLLIRSNNFNKNVNSEIYITDRQYADKINKSRFDLSGFFWGRNKRKRNQTVPLSFIEIKYSLNNDIKDINTQLQKYYNTVKRNISDIADETEYLKNLKIELGLINQSTDRLDALKTLKISKNIDDAKFIIALIDYNPNSKLFNAGKLKSLSFSNQLEIFNCGFAIWDDYLHEDEL